jgi:hypothetical protein
LPFSQPADFRVIGPVDPNDPSKGIYSEPVWKAADYRGSNNNISLVVGDFRGDGQHEIAFTYGNSQLNQCILDIVTVDPKTFVLQLKSQYVLLPHEPTFDGLPRFLYLACKPPNISR